MTSLCSFLGNSASFVQYRSPSEGTIGYSQSGGLSCHIDREHALYHGITELFERDAVNLRWYRRIPPDEIGSLNVPCLVLKEDNMRSLASQPLRLVMAVPVAVVLAVVLLFTSTAAQAGQTAVLIQNRMNNKCLYLLDFNGSNPTWVSEAPNGAPVGMWDCSRGFQRNALWYWDGAQIRNIMTHQCLELLSFNNANGARAGMWDCWGGANQQWYRVGEQIRNLMNNKCLELLSFNNANGAPVGMWDCWGGANQQWYSVGSYYVP